jgi:hypothetical protein
VTLRAALLALCLAAAGGARAAQPEGSVAFETILAGGRQWGGVGARAGVPAAGFALLGRYRALELGPVLVGTANDRQDGFYLGLACGLSWAPTPMTRLRLLGEGGRHRAGVESAYAGLPTVSTNLAYAGARLTALHLFAVERSPVVLFAARVGLGLDVAIRTDLQHASVVPSAPPELPGGAAALELGGTLASVGVVAILEW